MAKVSNKNCQRGFEASHSQISEEMHTLTYVCLMYYYLAFITYLMQHSLPSHSYGGV